MATLLSVASVRGSAIAADPPDKVACGDAYEQAQRLRRARELRAARSALRICARTECPVWIRRDCTPWLGDVESAIPSIVVRVHEKGGAPHDDAKIVVDGVTVAERARPEPIELDPGEHLVAVAAAGFVRWEDKVVLAHGERSRKVDVTLEPIPVAPRPEAVRPVRERSEAESTDRPLPPLFYVFGGATLIAGGVGTYFQIAGMNARADLHDCSPRCTQSQVDDARTMLTAGNVLLGVALVSLAATTIVYLTRN